MSKAAAAAPFLKFFLKFFLSKYSPSGATAAAVAEEEDEEEEAEAEEVGEGEDADAPKGPLKQLPGDYPFAREQDCDLRLFDFETFGGFGKEVRSTLREAANQLSNKLSHAQHLDEVTYPLVWHEKTRRHRVREGCSNKY